MIAFEQIGSDGPSRSRARMVAEETPVALEINGIGYAVLMATGSDIEDLAFGFGLSERLVDRADQILDVDLHHAEQGLIVRISIAPDCTPRLFDRIRHRTSESSCGICGLENLEQALRPLPVLPPRLPSPTDRIFKALKALSDRQHLNRQTGGVHAAALCGSDGDILMLREDVGRHNAFDKLVGAMARASVDWGRGFALLTSRCSYEIVEKAVLSQCPTLVTISAPTSLAVQRATSANLELLVLARPDSVLRVP